jgi:membrane-bound lytic murein transglycosylase F
MRLLLVPCFFLLCLLAGCTEEPKTAAQPLWTTSQDAGGDFDLPQIQQAGELIALTLSGPDTYYDYRGHHLGVQYLLCEQLASHLGVRLRMEVCRDTAEMVARLQTGEADLIAVRMDRDTTRAGWLTGDAKPLLREALDSWYEPSLFAKTLTKEKQLLSQRSVHRRVSAPMLRKGVISHYDSFFRQYGRRIGWDWRLLAALCYQESAFDPEARSWAGAIGLMQIMPATADHLGLPREEMTNPQQSIDAGSRYLQELEQELRDVPDLLERQNLAMASYNGGIHHIRDAMRLASRDGANPHRWSDVRTYVLRLSQPQYYQDTLVHYGYMRGQETADYVDKIRLRYQQYKRSAK